MKKTELNFEASAAPILSSAHTYWSYNSSLKKASGCKHILIEWLDNYLREKNKK